MTLREKKHHTPEQIIKKLRRVEALKAQGKTVAEAVKQIEVSEQTYYRWRNRYGDMSKSQVKRLKKLEKENARLKKLLAEKDLDIDILKEALEGNWRVSIAARARRVRKSRSTRAARAGRQ